MTARRLILNSLRYYWRSHLAVLLGVVAGTAVIGGALIVGDSVRESLRQLTLKRLGGVDFVLQGERFIRHDLASELAAEPRFAERFSTIAPGLSVRAGMQRREGEAIHRANQVGFWGLDEGLWSLIGPGEIAEPQDRDIILSAETARALEASVGDQISVWVELPTAIPRESLLGDRSQTTREYAFLVSAILDGSTTADRFQLVPTQQLTRNAYVSLDTLQEILDLLAVRPTQDDPLGKPARVNALFVSAKHPDQIDSALSDSETLTKLVSAHLQPADLGIRWRRLDARGYVNLESEQMSLEPAVADAGRIAAEKLGVDRSAVLVYLANEISNATDPGKYSMYSVLAGVDRATLEKSPFGTPEMLAGEWPAELGDNEIVLNDWLAGDLGVAAGDEILVRWHVVGSHGELPEEEHRFTVRGIARFEGTAVDDRGFTPELPGITDVETFDEWKKPFPMKMNRITGRDHEYWPKYRATPKGFVSLSTSQKLWRSRYGDLTSIRYAPREGESLDELESALSKEVLVVLEPERTGLAFQAVKAQGLAAASGTTDFSVLFVSFSFFLILSAAILIGLLFRLGIEPRIASIGLLNAVGLPEPRVRRIMLIEALLVLAVGAVAGAFAAIGYAQVMVYGLKTWWIGAIGTSELVVKVHLQSVLIGCAIGVGVAWVALWWSLRRLKNRPCRALLAGTLGDDLPGGASRGSRWAFGSAIAGGILLLLVLTGLVPDAEAFGGISWNVVAFFLVGILLLTSALTGLSAWIARDRETAVRGSGVGALFRLALRNAARNRIRSVLTVGLISSATFVIVAVAAGHRDPSVEQPRFDSGNGGFPLVAESSQPILFDLNTDEGREQLNLRVDGDDELRALWNRTEVVPFRVNPGQDASCLNLYQSQLPTILGATPRMVARGGFKFSGVSGDNPWRLLETPLPDADGLPVYPAMGDLNTLQYSLHKGIGARIPVPNEREPVAWLEIVGAYDGSIFQGTLVVSEANFLRFFPDRSGYGWFLIGDRDPQSDSFSRADAGRVAELLESQLNRYGFDADFVADRLNAFLQVQNTYLTTFQTLGGLGLLLGTIGLGTVMLRNVLERRSELALLRAVGFRNGALAVIVLGENSLLLVWGLVSGAAAALLAMTPHLLSAGADVPWRDVSLLLGGVFAVGMLSALEAVRQAIRTPVLSTLRGE